MPVVPTYDSFQAAPSQLPNVRVDAPQPSVSPGRIAQQVGQAMQQVGGATGQIALDMAQQANMVRLDDATNQAIKARTALQVEALQLKGKNALERPDGQSLADEYSTKFQKEMSGIQAGLSNDFQRQSFQHLTSQMQEQFYGALNNHMVQQQDVYRKETQQATIQAASEQAALLYGDPKLLNQSLDTVRNVVDQQLHDEGLQGDDNVRRAALANALGPTHLTIMRGMIQGGNIDGAQKYFDEHGDEMGLSARSTALEMVQQQGRLIRAQTFADQMDVQGKSQADALAEARQKFSGEDEAQAVNEIRQRFAERETAQIQAGKDISRTAWSQLMANSGAGMGAISPDVRAVLRLQAPEEERQMEDWLDAKTRRDKAEADKGAETDWNTYYGLRRMAVDEPDKFTQLDLMKSMPYLSNADFKHLTELQGTLTTRDAKAMESSRVLKSTLEQVGLEAKAVGVNLHPKPGTKDADEAAKFQGVLSQALDQATATKGSPLTDQEARRIGMNMLRDGIQQGTGIFGMFQTKRKGYQIAGDPDIDPNANFVVKRYADIPQNVRSQLEQEYRGLNNKGRPLNANDEAAIERAYTRGVQQGRF